MPCSLLRVKQLDSRAQVPKRCYVYSRGYVLDIPGYRKVIGHGK